MNDTVGLLLPVSRTKFRSYYIPEYEYSLANCGRVSGTHAYKAISGSGKASFR